MSRRTGGLVMVTPERVRRFNRSWPGSKLDPDLYYYFDFNSEGTLVDVWAQRTPGSKRRIDTEPYDGPELVALAEDAYNLLRTRKYNPAHGDYYLADSRTRTLKRVPGDEIGDWMRLQSSTRRLIRAGSNDFWRLVNSGWRIVNPYLGFQRLVEELEARGAKSPRALAAWIGRRKYGAKRFQKMAQEARWGKRR
jgi:hypothetical protein